MYDDRSACTASGTERASRPASSSGYAAGYARGDAQACKVCSAAKGGRRCELNSPIM
jgi:hypothetical protein